MNTPNNALGLAVEQLLEAIRLTAQADTGAPSEAVRDAMLAEDIEPQIREATQRWLNAVRGQLSETGEPDDRNDWRTWPVSRTGR